VFGVHNKTKAIVGTDYRDTLGLETLKHEIAQNTTGGITFLDIFEVYDGEDARRIIMFKIPAAVATVPTAWKNHWYGREGDSLGALSMEELDRLRGQVRRDWSRQIIENSGIRHLDAEAVRIARENYRIKHNREHISAEINQMTDEDFLTKAKLIVSGRLTNAAMVLLDNPDHDNIMDTPARVMWRFYGSNGMVKDYVEFNIPFITVVDKVYAKIRNLIYRYMPNLLTLFQTETQQYDASLLRELLNNCIAHQDYTTGGRIYLDEFEDMVVISNPGTFLPCDIREVLKPGYTAPYYRNQLLADAMVKFNMIDTVQMGIRKVFNIQRGRCFPMPDYDLGTPNKVSVRVYGKVLDENYTRLLFERPDLDIEDVFLIDRVQKKMPLAKEQIARLRKLKVVEGKAPNMFVSASIAEAINKKAQYIRNKGQDDQYYKRMILDYLNQWGKGTKGDFLELLKDKLPDVLSDKQKANRVRNYLYALSRAGTVQRDGGNQRTGVWVLAKKKD